MSVVAMRKPDDLAALLREMLAEQRRGNALLAELVKRDKAPDVTPLLLAIRDFFGGGRFSVGGLLDLGESREEFAAALAGLLDMNAPPRGRATQLGSLLAKTPQVVKVAERAGAAVYELSGTSGPEVP